MLLDYVRNVTESVINEKEAQGQQPACLLYSELLERLRTDALECMRELHRNGEFRAQVSGVNKEPSLTKV